MRLITDNTTKGTKRKSITHRQDLYCQYIAQGMSQIDAYCKAYGHDKNKATGRKLASYHTIASELSNDPKLIERIDYLRSKGDVGELHDPQRIKEFVLSKLLETAENSTNPATVLKACELLGKVGNVGLFVERTENQTTIRSPETVENELKQRLKAIAGGK